MKIVYEDFTESNHTKTLKPIELNILIDNLISNARKVKASEMNISLSESEDGNLTMRFTDNGLGIKEENMKRLYDFGFTTTDGSGIGLYHVKEIIKSMGGTIKAENNKNGIGATFTLEFK